MKKLIALTILTCLLVYPLYAGELRKKPFKDEFGNDQYEYVDGDYKVSIRKKHDRNVYGQIEYQTKDNEGNEGVIRRKPFKDSYGNPVYEDTLKRKDKKKPLSSPTVESHQSSGFIDILLGQEYTLAGTTPRTTRQAIQESPVLESPTTQIYEALLNAGYSDEDALEMSYQLTQDKK